ncbi:hypothetical protein HFN70_22665 [Rhizobium laguerreae]|uniref:hypothetical protein n=1 Tax=Rhizobium laguerreae TaxID=1076926 RepID=UPI001C91B610|nr:hypothetical protein [Rhizobium laguerreae]MBY3521865.1 hypothetical protein [Rhizobium laguerreae]
MSWFSKILKRPKGDDIKAVAASLSIDTSGPEFADLYPTRDAVEHAITGTERFKPSDLGWIADIAFTRMNDGMNYRGPIQEITRSGPPMAPDVLKAHGLNARRKIGTRFVEAIAVGTVDEAVEALDLALHTEWSKANQLHNLRRMQKCGIGFCKFSAPGGDANLPLESELNGKRLSIDEAIDLVKSRPADIRRSVFMGDVKF